MPRPAPHRVLLIGVVAPLLVGGFVPALGGVALVWLVCGLLAMGLTSLARAQDDAVQEMAAALGPGWRVAQSRRPIEDPNSEAARVGSWG